MSFEEVKGRSNNPTIRLGGEDDKGNKNPTTVEGYYLGSRSTTTQYGEALIHSFRTASGDVDVWGKTDMNNKLEQIGLGVKTRVSFTGKKAKTKNGSMQLFTVAQDAGDFDPDYASTNEAVTDEDDVPSYEAEEAYVARPTKPKTAAPVADTAQQARAKAMLAARN